MGLHTSSLLVQQVTQKAVGGTGRHKYLHLSFDPDIQQPATMKPNAFQREFHDTCSDGDMPKIHKTPPYRVALVPWLLAYRKKYLQVP